MLFVHTYVSLYTFLVFVNLNVKHVNTTLIDGNYFKTNIIKDMLRSDEFKFNILYKRECIKRTSM